MLGAFDWLNPRRRRADSASPSRRAVPPRERIEPTLPDPLAPASGRVRLRIRYNDAFAVATTEQEALLHGVPTASAWFDCFRDDPSREIIVEVPVPRFAEPAPNPVRPAPVAVDPPPAPARADVGSVSTPVSSGPAPMQPTPPPAAAFRPCTAALSPLAHAERLLAWCRRRGLVGEVIIFDMERAYATMCAEAGLRPRPWNPVSKELTLLITGQVGKKSYVMFEGEKRRVFRIPALQDELPPGRQSAPQEAATDPAEAMEIAA